MQKIFKCCASACRYCETWFWNFICNTKPVKKIEVYQSYDIPVYFGGTLFEAFLIRNQFEDYIAVLQRL